MSTGRSTLGERLDLELMTGEQLVGTIAWRRGSEVGLRFDAPIDVFAVIAAGYRLPAGRAPPDAARRAGRAGVAGDGRPAPSWSPPATFPRAAPSSTCRTRSSVEERVLVTLDGLPPQQGVVRWSTEPCRRHRLRAGAALAGADGLAEGPAPASSARRRSPRPSPRRRRRRPSRSRRRACSSTCRRGCARARGAGRSTSQLDHHPDGHLRQLRRARHGLAALDRAAGPRRLAGADRRQSTAIASPASSPSRFIPPCWSGC